MTSGIDAGPGGGGAAVALVTPRFGPGVVGGSEALVAEVARGLAGRGWAVEVLTTCAADHYTWADRWPPGVSEVDGVTLRRFPVVEERSEAGQRALEAALGGATLSPEDQLTLVNFPFRVPRLLHHLLRHGARYQAVVFAPYLSWTTIVGAPALGGRAIVMPCLHDEPYARVGAVRPLLAGAGRLWLLTEPEHDLAHRLGPLAPHTVVGAGIHVPPGYGAPSFAPTRPYVLYAGRREDGKGWSWLLDQWRQVLAGGEDPGVDLVTMGVGEAGIEPALAGRVIDLGLVAEGERDAALAGALAYLQPSLMESFSRSIMEAWLARTPVLARRGGDVVAWHIERSGAGRTWGSAAELAGLLRWLARSPGEAAGLGAAGRRYVLERYTWPQVLERMEVDLRAMAVEAAGPGGMVR